MRDAVDDPNSLRKTRNRIPQSFSFSTVEFESVFTNGAPTTLAARFQILRVVSDFSRNNFEDNIKTHLKEASEKSDEGPS